MLLGLFAIEFKLRETERLQDDHHLFLLAKTDFIQYGLVITRFGVKQNTNSF